MNKISAQKFRALKDEFNEIDEDTLSQIVDFLDDSESSESSEEPIMYKGHNLTYIIDKISKESDCPLHVSERILKYYIDVTIPKNECLVCYSRSDDQIADRFTINTDGRAYDNNHPIDKYQELIDTQDKDILLKLMKETSGTRPLLYYAKPIDSYLHSELMNLLPTLWFVEHYDLIEQNPELTKLLMNRKDMYNDSNEWIFSKVRDKTPEMCLDMIKKSSYCICIEHVPFALITEEMLCIVALNALGHTMVSTFSKKSRNFEKITQRVANYIARNTHSHFGTWEDEFNWRIKLIPEQFQNTQTYVRLISSIEKMKGSQPELIKKVPEQYRNEVIEQLTKIKK
ncbi:MAG: hypothetical protein E6R13_09195 [Spirochaetes bacterium]|nr:MAG: hypothetical protein E6R13_09195 [Spirochaetota bacterium]